MSEFQMKLIDEDKLPVKIKKRTDEWVKLLLKIPKGKAWVVTEKDIPTSADNIKTMVTRLTSKGLIPKSFRVVQRTKEGKTTLYIINSAKVEMEQV